MPDFFCVPRRDVSNSDGPRMRTIRFDEIAVGSIAPNCQLAHERNLSSIKRPFDIRIVVHACRDETNCPRAYIVDADKTVISSSGNEGKLGAVRRPVLT